LAKSEGTINTQIHVPEASVVGDILIVSPLSEPQIRTDLESLEYKVEYQCGNR